MRASDVLRDVVVEMHARRSRNVLMMVAVALSTGALVVAVGLASLAARQVDTDIAASTLDLITVTAADGAAGLDGTVFPADAGERAGRLPLVEAAGLRLDVTGLVELPVSRAGLPAPEEKALTVSGMNEGYLLALAADRVPPTATLLDGDLPVVLLGRTAAATLDIPVTRDPTGYGVLLGGTEHAVVGYLPERAELDGLVAIPYERALTSVGHDDESRMLVRTERGAGDPVARSVRLAVRPDAAEQLVSSHVVSTETLRTGVASQLARLAGWVGGLLLALTLLLIANAMVVSVMARTREVGVRRALGASRGDVASLFLTEGALTGLLGGLAGASFAAVALVAVARSSGWTAALDVWWLAAGPLLGLVTGLASSAYPAARAAGIQPALAVRSD